MIPELTHFIVVDDDAINNRMCKFAIKRRFAAPCIGTFLMPEVALEMIAKEYTPFSHKQTVVFLDINMPSMNAWRFLDVFSEFDKDVMKQFKIYILSSSNDKFDIQRANDHPIVAGYISKPLMANALEKVFIRLEQNS